MDSESIKTLAVFGSTMLLSITVVGAFVAKFAPKVTRAVRIAKSALDVADAALAALKDNAVTKEEVEVLMKEIAELKAELKA